TLATQQFTAIAKDQFGNPLSAPPAFTWTLTGIGTLSTGLYTAPNTAGKATVTVSAGGLSTSASWTVVHAAPTNLICSASSTQASLSWQESSTGITGFIIQRSTNGTSWSQVATVGGTVTSYQDNTVRKKTTYYYRICAVSSVGNSAWSASVTLTTPATAGTIVKGTTLAIPQTLVVSPSVKRGS